MVRSCPRLPARFQKTQRGLTTMLSHNPPPFHAEHIGSLLRPSNLLDQRARFARGEIDRTKLTKAEDEAIKDALALQQRVGPQARDRRRIPSPLLPQFLLPPTRG